MNKNAGSDDTSANSGPGNAGLVRGYRPELDVVRSLAFLFVFVHHFLFLTRVGDEPATASLLASRGLLRALLAFRDACAMGLCLFFCLSAYLITYLLLSEQSRRGFISVRDFYIRRALRIWPLYFLGIAIGIAIAVLLGEKGQIVSFVWFLLFLGNFHDQHLNNPMLPLWSISIEEQFYLIWPWIMRGASRKRLLCCIALLFLLANATLFYFGQHHADPGSVVWSNTFVQFEMFATGALLATLGRPSNLPRPLLGLALVWTGPLLWFIACFFFHPKPAAFTERAQSGMQLVAGYGLVALGCASLLHGFCLLGPSLMPMALIRLGRISYGLYVYHVLVSEIVLAVLPPLHRTIAWVAASGLALGLTISVAALSYKILETPFLRWKRRFEVLHSRPI